MTATVRRSSSALLLTLFIILSCNKCFDPPKPRPNQWIAPITIGVITDGQ